MSGTGAIPKVPRKKVRKPFSEITNIQSSEGSLKPSATSSTRAIYDERDILRKELSETQRKLDSLVAKVHSIENKAPVLLSTMMKDCKDDDGLLSQAQASFPIQEFREVKKEIKETEMKISGLHNEFLNKTFELSFEKSMTETLEDEEEYKFFKPQEPSQKKSLSVEEWLSTEKIQRYVGLRVGCSEELNNGDAALKEIKSSPSEKWIFNTHKSPNSEEMKKYGGFGEGFSKSLKREDAAFEEKPSRPSEKESFTTKKSLISGKEKNDFGLAERFSKPLKSGNISLEEKKPYRYRPKVPKNRIIDRTPRGTLKVKSNTSTASIHPSRKAEEESSSSDNFCCVDCQTFPRHYKYHTTEPKVVVVKTTEKFESDEENESRIWAQNVFKFVDDDKVELEDKTRTEIRAANIIASKNIVKAAKKVEPENEMQAEGGIGARSEHKVDDGIKVQSESNDIIEKQNAENQENDNSAEKEDTDLSYRDMRVYDFIESINKLTKTPDSELESTKVEEPNTSEITQDFNNSLSWEEGGENDLKLKLSKLSVIAVQSTKLIELCVKKPKMEKSEGRIEAERILLLSGIKQDMLKKKLDKLKHKEESLPKNGCLRISQIRMPLIYSPDAHPNKKRYFLVVFQTNDELFSSSVIEANRHSYLDIAETFIFEDLPADFAIKVSVYSMFLQKESSSTQKIAVCLPFKFMRGLFKSAKKETEADPPIICWNQRDPAFVLHGQCEISLANWYQRPFTINGVPPKIALVNTMECRIETAVSLENSEKGYLSIGSVKEDGAVLWRRKWCLLDGSKLKMWDTQNDAEEGSPNEMNLSRCVVQWDCMKNCTCSPK